MILFRNPSDSSSDRSFHPSTTFSTYCKTSDDSLGSNIHTSEIDDVISDGSVSFPTSKIEVTTSNDENEEIGNPNVSQIIIKPSCCSKSKPKICEDNRISPTPCDLGKDFLVNTNPKVEISKEPDQSAAELLQLAANAFFTSENEISSSEEYCEDFWPHG